MTKRKATTGEGPELPILTANSIYDDCFPTDLFVRIGGYWNGKDFSSYLLAAQASKSLRKHLQETSDKILNCLADRCYNFLESIDAPESMKDVWQEKSQEAQSDLRPMSRRYMESVSKWCAFLDYCEFSGLCLSKSRLEQNDPIRPIWIIGAGTFGQSGSPSILSVPAGTWRPDLLFLGEQWMVEFPKQYPKLNHFFPMNMVPALTQNLDTTVAIMSWNDPEYLAFLDHAFDIRGGMMVYHAYFGEDGDRETAERS